MQSDPVICSLAKLFSASYFCHRRKGQFLDSLVLAPLLRADFRHQLDEGQREADIQEPEGEEGKSEASGVVQQGTHSWTFALNLTIISMRTYSYHESFLCVGGTEQHFLGAKLNISFV